MFGAALKHIPASVPKSMIGRLFNGGSMVDIACAILGLQNSVVLPTVGVRQLDPNCPLDYVPDMPRAKSLRHVLVGARGFGGFNSAIILKRPA